MRMPKEGTNPYTLCMTLFQHGPQTMEQGIALHKWFGTKPSATHAVYSKCVCVGWIDKRGETYHLLPHVENYLSGCTQPEPPQGEITPPPYRKPFTPMKLQPRHPRIEERSFITCSGAPSDFWSHA